MKTVENERQRTDLANDRKVEMRVKKGLFETNF